MHSPFPESGRGTPQSEGYPRLLDIAERIAEDFRDDPRVEAAILVGSMARECVDRVSDIDLMLYINEYFTEEEVSREQEQAKASGGGVYGANPEHGFGVWRCVGGVKVDLAFNMVSNMEALINEVLVNHTLENDMHLITDGIQRSKVLFGEKLIAQWKERMHRFPEDLGTKMITEHLRVSPLWVARDMCAGRNERVWLSEMMLEYLRRSLWVLCGLNGRYYPGKLKGFEQVVGTLDIAPDSFVRRAHALLGSDPDATITTLAGLVPDVYDLVDRHRPDIDTSAARAWFLTDVVCR